MGKKTHGPYLIQAIESNSHEKVHEICAKQIGNKEKVREMVLSHVKRLASEHFEIPLLLAAQLPDPSIITYFIHKFGVDINFVFKEQLGRRIKIKTCLIMGVRRGLYDTVELMLTSNADPNAQDHKGRTALHHAVRKADFRMAKMLLSRGAQPSLIDKGENTPLHVASIFGHVELCKMLIHYGGDLYKKGQLGAIPIHIAAKEGHVALLRLFCEHDVNPNIKMPCYDGREKAALHVAAEEGHSECVSCLVEILGADPNLGDSEGETPLTCCVIREYDPMGMKSKEDYTEAVKVLLRNGAEVNLQNGRGESALHLAARNEFHKIVELLLQAGIDPLLQDNAGDKAINLVNEEDAVTLQIIKQAMENRERYLNDVFEMKAKGYSTSLDVLSTGLSTSMLNRRDSISSDISSRLGRASSTPGLLGVPANQMTYGGYLQPLRNGLGRSGDGNDSVSTSAMRTAVQMHNSSKSHSSSSGHDTSSQINNPMRDKSPEQTYARIDPDEMEDSVIMPKHPIPGSSSTDPNDKGKNSKFGLPKFLKRQPSQKSTDSSQFDDRSLSIRHQPHSPQKPGIVPIEQGTRQLPSPPPSTIRDSMISTEASTDWGETPRSSISTFRPDSDFGVGKTTENLMAKVQQKLAEKKFEFSDINTTQYESLPGAPMAPRGRSTPTMGRAGVSPRAGRREQLMAAEENGVSDSDDTFFDDESFDSISEATVEMVQQQQKKIEMANQKLYENAGKTAGANEKKPQDNHMQKWISEQATLVQQRNFKNAGGPIAQSTPPSSNIQAHNVPFSDTDDQFTSVSQQVGRPAPPSMKPKPVVDKNANSRPMPPPRPPKHEHKPAVSSKPHLSNEQKKKAANKPSVSSIETENSAVHFEVDDKDPGQTVIRIMPANKNKHTPASPKPKPQARSESTTTGYADSTPVSSSFTDTSYTSPQKESLYQQNLQGGYRAGMLDTDSEVQSQVSSSVFRPTPKKRNKLITRTESRRDSPSKRLVRNIQQDHDIKSDASDFENTESDDENPNIAHITARHFIAPSVNINVPAELRASQDLFEVEPAVPQTPTTPTIKMTMKSPDTQGEVPFRGPPHKVKVLPEPPPKPDKQRIKVMPEPPPKVTLHTFPKPEPPAKHESPRVAAKPDIPSRVDKPKPPPTLAKPTAPKTIHIQPAPPKPKPIASLAAEDNFSTGSMSEGTEDEALPTIQIKPSAKPRAKERKHSTSDHLEEVKSEPKETKHKSKPKAEDVEPKAEPSPPQHEVEHKPKKTKKAKKEATEATEDGAEEPGTKTKTKKKKKKVKAAKETQQVDNTEAQPPPIPASLPPTEDPLPPPQTTPLNEHVDVDDTYLKPLPHPSIPIEEVSPSSKEEPGMVTSRQKRKAKRKHSKAGMVDNIETEEMKPPEEPAVYQNSPPPRAKVQHSTANKEGVPYALVNRTAKTADGLKPGAPVFVKIERSQSDLSEDSGASNRAPPVPAPPPHESPYAEISVVDEIVNTPERAQSNSSQEALDLENGKRRVTIGDKQFIPNNVKRAKDHDHRKVVYPCGDELDFEIIGGNADGVFAHNVLPGSAAQHAGLCNGDRIMRINGRSMNGKTREDATALVNTIKRVMDLTVRERHDIYKTILEHNGIGDAFCVRAHFNYKPQQQGELFIKPGDIFSVKDTLPSNTFGYWRVVKLNAAERELSNGYIFNMRRAEQWSLDQRMNQLKAFERQKGGFMKKGFNRSKSLDRLKKGKSQEDLSLDTRNIIAYEKIEQRKAPFPKPVLLLGLFCDNARDFLAKEHASEFVVPKEKVETPPDPKAFNKDPVVKLDIIKSICYSGTHCLTILSPPAIEMLQKTDLNPIVVYLAPGSKAIVKIVKSRFAPNFDRKPSSLYEEAMGFEKLNAHLFTATVPYTENDAWVENLMEMIKLLQEQPQWYVVKEEPEDDDEDYVEPNLGPGPQGQGHAHANVSFPGLMPPSAHGGRLNRSMEHIPDAMGNTYHAAGRSPDQQRMRSQSSGGMLGTDFDAITHRPPKSILKNKGLNSSNSDSGSTSSTSNPMRPYQGQGRPTPPSHFPPRPPQHSMTSMLQSPSSPGVAPPAFYHQQQQQQQFRQPGPGQYSGHPHHPPPGGYRGPLQPAEPISHRQQQPAQHYNQAPGYPPPNQGPGYPPNQRPGYHPPNQAPVAPQQQVYRQPAPQQQANLGGFHPGLQQTGAAAISKPQPQSHSGKETSF